MKHLLLTGLSVLLLLTACQKDNETVNNPVTTDPTDKVLSSGIFSSNAHTTTGTVDLIEKSSGDKLLVFRNFKTDGGPDLRIYLATDTNASTFTEISNDVKNGTYQLNVPANANISTQKYVLIWCKQFSVLFGNAELK